MKINELKEIISQYQWLVGIRKSYQEHLELIKRERDCYTVYAIMYATNGDIQSLKPNPHRPINCAYIEAALEDALRSLNQEINEIADKLKKCGIDIDDDEEL